MAPLKNKMRFRELRNQVKRSTTTVREGSVEINGDQILNLLNAQLSEEIPAEARVYVQIDGTVYDITKEIPVCIAWRVEEIAAETALEMEAPE